MNSKRFIFFSDQVTTFFASFSDISIQVHTISSLEVELEDLERCWRQLLQVYEIVMTSDNTTATTQEQESVYSKFSTCCKASKECKAPIFNLPYIEKHKLAKSQSAEESKTKGSKDAAYSLKVPPCDTELFSGGYYKWSSFRDMFSASYGNHPKLSLAQKLFHLRATTLRNLQ